MTDTKKLIEEARRLQPTWHRGMYGSRDDMYANVKPLISRLADALEAAERLHTRTGEVVIADHPYSIECGLCLSARHVQPQGEPWVQSSPAFATTREAYEYLQGEPSDAQVLAALDSFYGRKAQYMTNSRFESMRAALRAAGVGGVR